MDLLTDTKTKGNVMYNWLYERLLHTGIPAPYLDLVNSLILFTALLFVLLLADILARKILVRVLTKAARKTASKFDDFLVSNKTLVHLARLIPLLLATQLLPAVFTAYPEWTAASKKLIDILFLIVWVMIFRSVFRALRDYMRMKERLRDKPLDSYVQVGNIFLFFVAGIILFSLLTGNSPWAFLGALGAASAVLMLVFKDTILGFVASIQVSTNDMVRIGDWIEMPKYGADGDVIEINLNTVKVQNWDKTITTIPTYYLISDSFKNWRGMQDAGGRRIKRAINIKISSIRFLSEDDIHALSSIQLLSPYIIQRQAEIDLYNKKNHAKRNMPVNGRNLSNIGLFRRYVDLYAHNNPLIRKDMTLIVRQLAPNEHGLPIELYMFTADTRWAIYEDIMADIFDHLLSSIHYFHLEVFEAPASDDVRQLGNHRMAVN